ncbi:MAG TPA: hypothetical protein PK156_48885, partial [Polyangium sp.]|nr:hypothetical protein [Polyangium sp.]
MKLFFADMELAAILFVIAQKSGIETNEPDANPLGGVDGVLPGRELSTNRVYLGTKIQIPSKTFLKQFRVIFVAQ